MHNNTDNLVCFNDSKANSLLQAELHPSAGSGRRVNLL